MQFNNAFPYSCGRENSQSFRPATELILNLYHFNISDASFHNVLKSVSVRFVHPVWNNLFLNFLRLSKYCSYLLPQRPWMILIYKDMSNWTCQYGDFVDIKWNVGPYLVWYYIRCALKYCRITFHPPATFLW